MKISILSLILLLNADLISSQPHDAVECRYSGDMLYNDCSNGYVGAELDNVGNLPDSCCLVYIFTEIVMELTDVLLIVIGIAFRCGKNMPKII